MKKLINFEMEGVKGGGCDVSIAVSVGTWSGATLIVLTTATGGGAAVIAAAGALLWAAADCYHSGWK